MARKTARPGRTLVVFFVGLGIAFGLVALGGSWKPELGLDLQGGTRITLTAEGDPSAESLNEARAIIEQRVNGSGVSEAEVTTQGNQFIVVEIPGDSRRDLEETVKRQAQLRFRLVACSSQAPGPCASASPTPGGDETGTDPGTNPGSGVTVQPEPSLSPDADPSQKPGEKASSSPKNRAPFLLADKDTKKKDKKQDESPSPSASPSDSPSDSPSPSEIPAPEGGELVDQPLKWMDSPDSEAVKAFNQFECPTDGSAPVVEDDPDKPLVTCGTGDELGVKYLLSASAVEGTDLETASAGIPQNTVSWVVSLEIGGQGRQEFAKISRGLVGTEKQFAIVLDGQVISAPTMEGTITNGQAQISGNFTEASAQSLATSLKFGSLPIAFEKEGTQIDVIGPSLAGNQLSAGIAAGIAGLLLVMLYCLIYYRGLGLVVIASLVVAGGATYAMVLLLSKTAGFTLSLPGIAGLIVAVGITADSFIVYFERIRDEMRDGKSMRVAVESGWVRARNTCLAADAVSLLAAVVLYIFAAGVVKGFAFALGLSTVIDLVIFFWFTHPMVSWLAKFHFFNQGHKLSGLDPDALGIDRLPAGGRA
jgi:preprotein translocase subunit SecD